MISKVLISLLLAGGLQVAPGQNAGPSTKEPPPYQMSFLRPVTFNYLIYADNLFSPNDGVLWNRNVYVLMDENAFSEANLKELFEVLSEAFPEPKRLHVTVNSSLEQVRPLGPSGGSEEPDLPNADKHHWAVYLRMGDDEFFRYIAHPPEGKWTTVVLKGKD